MKSRVFVGSLLFFELRPANHCVLVYNHPSSPPPIVSRPIYYEIAFLAFPFPEVYITLPGEKRAIFLKDVLSRQKARSFLFNAEFSALSTLRTVFRALTSFRRLGAILLPPSPHLLQPSQFRSVFRASCPPLQSLVFFFFLSGFRPAIDVPRPYCRAQKSSVSIFLPPPVEWPKVPSLASLTFGG